MHTLRLACFVLAVSASCPWATATMIDVGNHDLFPDRAGQEIEIHVSGGDQVQGLNFRVQVADGGPDPMVGGSVSGPAITDVDLVAGTIFDGNSNAQSSLLRLPQVWVQTITTETGTVSADGLLATLTLDTTGFETGSFALSLENTMDGATDFAGLPIDITDGVIQIIPEPSSCLLLIAGLIGLWSLGRFHPRPPALRPIP